MRAAKTGDESIQQHLDSLSQQSWAKASHLAGKKRGAASRYLRRGNFNGILLGTYSQRIGKELGISHMDWLEQSASL